MCIDEKVRDIVEKAVLWAHCPKSGAYQGGGPSMEDVCEALSVAVETLTEFTPEGEDISEYEALGRLYDVWKPL